MSEHVPAHVETNDPEVEKEILRSIRAYFDGCSQAYAERKRDILHTVCAPDMVGFGTGLIEKARTRDEFEDLLFSPKEIEFDKINFRHAWVQITHGADVAAAAAECEGEIFVGGDEIKMPPFRASWHFRYRPSDDPGQLPWQMTHIHYSFPDNQAENENIDNAAMEEYNRQLQQMVEDQTKEIQLQSERKSAFLASMAHELRTPMNAILGFTGMVLRRAGDALPERQRGNLEKVVEAGNHLLELINGLLDLSKIEAGRMDVEPEAFRPEDLVRSCCETVEPLVKSGVELTYEVDESIGEANTDASKLRHIIGNLLSNAVKFTEQGSIKVNVGAVHNHLRFTVTDTGQGMPKEALDTIFDEFQQVKGSNRKHKGTGLGLSIAKQYAGLMGGTIGVDSELGEGTVFTLQVPAVYQETGQALEVAE